MSDLRYKNMLVEEISQLRWQICQLKDNFGSQSDYQQEAMSRYLEKVDMAAGEFLFNWDPRTFVFHEGYQKHNVYPHTVGRALGNLWSPKCTFRAVAEALTSPPFKSLNTAWVGWFVSWWEMWDSLAHVFRALGYYGRSDTARIRERFYLLAGEMVSERFRLSPISNELEAKDFEHGLLAKFELINSIFNKRSVQKGFDESKVLDEICLEIGNLPLWKVSQRLSEDRIQTGRSFDQEESLRIIEHAALCGIKGPPARSEEELRDVIRSSAKTREEWDLAYLEMQKVYGTYMAETWEDLVGSRKKRR